MREVNKRIARKERIERAVSMITHYITAHDDTQNITLSWPCGGEYASLDERLAWLVSHYGIENFTWSIAEV